MPLILHPTLICFAFSVLDQFWEDKKCKKPVKALINMFDFMIHLFSREENIKRCAENDAIRLILEKFSFVLDSTEFANCSRLLLELFSTSSSFHVSPAALHIIINKLTNEKAPIESLTQSLVTLFNRTAKMVSHMQIPMPIESVFNNLYDVTHNQSEWNNSVWNRGLLHYKIDNIFPKKRDQIIWSYSFWLRANEDFDKDIEVEQEDYETDSRDSTSSSRVGMVILQEEIYDVNFMNGTHVVTFGGETYMIQLWIENNRRCGP